jgi:hypothetical protein
MDLLLLMILDILVIELKAVVNAVMELMYLQIKVDL